DVADGARGLLDSGGDAGLFWRRPQIFALLPVYPRPPARAPRPPFADGGGGLRGDEGRFAWIRSARERDVGGWQRRSPGCGLELGIAPLGDLSEEDPGIDVTRQLDALGIAREVVTDHDLAARHRQELDAARDLGHLLVGHRGVTGCEVHGVVDEVLDAGAT